MKNISKEDGFNITLPMLVEGNEVFGKKFKEKTFLLYISHYGASFWLKTSVSLGSELKCIINLPPKLAEDKNLKLIINGEVVFIETSKDQNSKKRISCRFKNKYIIKSDE